MTNDPFRHTPDLRPLVKPAEDSRFRNFEPSDMDELAASMGLGDWRYSDEQRQADLTDFLQNHGARDLWVFAYGSLMWDPCIIFDEVRHAFAPQHSRKFILVDDMARGSVDYPGLMAALDTGAGCAGLVYRISADRLDHEMNILWKRERLTPAYLNRMIDIDTPQGPVSALAFVADHDCYKINAGLPFDAQVAAISKAQGVLGTNLEYISNLKQHFDTFGIVDDDLNALFDAATQKTHQNETDT